MLKKISDFLGIIFSVSPSPSHTEAELLEPIFLLGFRAAVIDSESAIIRANYSAVLMALYGSRSFLLQEKVGTLTGLLLLIKLLLPCERLKIYPSHLVCKVTLYFPVSNVCKKPCPSSESDNCLMYVLTSLSSCGINFDHNLAPRDDILKHEFESRYLEYEVLKCKKSKADGIP